MERTTKQKERISRSVEEGFIKPCPLCGSMDIKEDCHEADFDKVNYKGQITKRKHTFCCIKCHKCECNIHVSVIGKGNDLIDTQKQVREKWNKRAASQ